MRPTDRRRITLFDVMALIAATAIGLAIARVGWPPQALGPGATAPAAPSRPSGYKSRMAVMPTLQRIAPAFSCMAAWSGALLASRLRPPRPRWRRLAGQPGTIAAIATLLVWLIEAPPIVWLSWYDGRFGWSSPTRLAQVAANSTVMLGHHAGLAVAIAWLTLALGGRWRPERSWVDRSGRVLGVAWIASAILCAVTLDQSVWWANFLDP